MKFKHSLVFALLLTGGVSFSEAATINVSASAPDVLNGANGSCSLREAITNINADLVPMGTCAAGHAGGRFSGVDRQ